MNPSEFTADEEAVISHAGKAFTALRRIAESNVATGLVEVPGDLAEAAAAAHVMQCQAAANAAARSNPDFRPFGAGAVVVPPVKAEPPPEVERPDPTSVVDEAKTEIPKAHECAACGRHFGTARGLGKHVQMAHRRSRTEAVARANRPPPADGDFGGRVECDECSRSYRSAERLAAHKRNSHRPTSERPSGGIK